MIFFIACCNKCNDMTIKICKMHYTTLANIGNIIRQTIFPSFTYTHTCKIIYKKCKIIYKKMKSIFKIFLI